jgi:hypothetical protein
MLAKIFLSAIVVWIFFNKLQIQVNQQKSLWMELLVFRRYQLDAKDIKCPFQWWQKHEALFPTIRFLT